MSTSSNLQDASSGSRLLGRIVHLSPAPGDLSPGMGAFQAPPQMKAVDIYELVSLDLADVSGMLITGMCDQRYLGRCREQLEGFVRGGGRILFNGHVIEPFLPGLPKWRKLVYTRPEDLVIERANEHPVWDGVDVSELLYRTGVPGVHSPERLAEIGVAGFYGRGYTLRLPAEATVINTIGQLRAPIDYLLPIGAGEVLVHGGLDLGVFAATPGTTLTALGSNIIAWLGGVR